MQKIILIVMVAMVAMMGCDDSKKTTPGCGDSEKSYCDHSYKDSNGDCLDINAMLSLYAPIQVGPPCAGAKYLEDFENQWKETKASLVYSSRKRMPTYAGSKNPVEELKEKTSFIPLFGHTSFDVECRTKKNFFVIVEITSMKKTDYGLKPSLWSFEVHLVKGDSLEANKEFSETYCLTFRGGNRDSFGQTWQCFMSASKTCAPKTPLIVWLDDMIRCGVNPDKVIEWTKKDTDFNVEVHGVITTQ